MWGRLSLLPFSFFIQLFIYTSMDLCIFILYFVCVCAQIVPPSMPEKIWMPDTEFCLPGCCTVLAFLSFAVGSNLLLSGLAFKICEAAGYPQLWANASLAEVRPFRPSTSARVVIWPCGAWHCLLSWFSACLWDVFFSLKTQGILCRSLDNFLQTVSSLI